MHYSKAIDELLIPKENLVSVIDSFDAIGRILEKVQKVKDKEVLSEQDISVIVIESMFTLGFYPFWQAHGSVFRPILINALAAKNCIHYFFEEAIPTALTIAMPNKQLEYDNIRQRVIKILRS